MQSTHDSGQSVGVRWRCWEKWMFKQCNIVQEAWPWMGTLLRLPYARCIWDLSSRHFGTRNGLVPSGVDGHELCGILSTISRFRKSWTPQLFPKKFLTTFPTQQNLTKHNNNNNNNVGANNTFSNTTLLLLLVLRCKTVQEDMTTNVSHVEVLLCTMHLRLYFQTCSHTYYTCTKKSKRTWSLLYSSNHCILKKLDLSVVPKEDPDNSYTTKLDMKLEITKGEMNAAEALPLLNNQVRTQKQENLLLVYNCNKISLTATIMMGCDVWPTGRQQ